MTRLLKQAEALGVDFEWHKHHRVAKKRARSIIYTKGQDQKKGLYSKSFRFPKMRKQGKKPVRLNSAKYP